MDSMTKPPDDIFELDWRLLSLDFPLYEEPWQTSSHWTHTFVHIPIPTLAIDLNRAHQALSSQLCTTFRSVTDPFHPIWRYPESPIQSPDDRIERFASTTIQVLRQACELPDWIQISRKQSHRREELIAQLPLLVEALCLDMHCPAQAEPFAKAKTRL